MPRSDASASSRPAAVAPLPSSDTPDPAETTSRPAVTGSAPPSSRASTRGSTGGSTRASDDAALPTSDLQEPDARAWERATPEPGGLPALARRVSSDLDALAERVVAAVLAEVPTYREQSLVPAEDLVESIRHNLDAMLLGLAQRRGPSTRELSVRRALGTRRALQGMPVDAVVWAYHIGYRELWTALVGAVEPGDEAATAELLGAATTAWEWVHKVTDAMAAAHAATVRTIQAREVGARQRFVELLVAGEADGAEARRLADALGFDPRGRFGAIVVRGAGDDAAAVDLQRALETMGDGPHAVVARGPSTVVVSQVTDVEDAALDALAGRIDQTCREVLPDATIGMGTVRRGLAGARQSFQDAERVLGVIEDGTTGVFDEWWLWATLADIGPRLDPLLARGTSVAAEHPHLADAVRVFADAGFSVSEAGRRLEVHANTVAYRLDRWEELTGWDPRSFAGIVRSVAALRLGGHG